MLTEIYIEALLVDEDLADQVWEAWDAQLPAHARLHEYRGRGQRTQIRLRQRKC